MTDFDAVLAAAQAWLAELQGAAETAAAHKAEARTAQTAAEQAQAKLAARVAELDEREAAIRKREVELHQKTLADAELDRTRGKLSADVSTREKQLKTRLMREAGILHNFNEQMQDWPSFEDLEAEPLDLTSGPITTYAGPKAARTIPRRPRA